MTQACIYRECQTPCPFETCGLNAECSNRNHRARCACLPGHKGNPYDNCRQYECLTDPDCSTTLTCRNEKCVDPCDCAQNAECQPRNHRGICSCIPDFTGDPYGIACTPSKDFITLLEIIPKLLENDFSSRILFVKPNHRRFSPSSTSSWMSRRR